MATNNGDSYKHLNIKLSVVCRDCLTPLDFYQRGEDILVEPCSKCQENARIEMKMKEAEYKQRNW